MPPNKDNLIQMIRHIKDVYSLGGLRNNVPTNRVNRLRDGNWTPMPSMTTARYSFAAVLYSSTIYVFGGGGTATTSVEAFDIAAQSWTNKTTPPSGAAASTPGSRRLSRSHLAVWWEPRNEEELLHVQPSNGRLVLHC